MLLRSESAFPASSSSSPDHVRGLAADVLFKVDAADVLFKAGNCGLENIENSVTYW